MRSLALFLICLTSLSAIDQPIVFVSRKITEQGSFFWNVPKGVPGIGVFSRFQVAEPGRLIVLEPDGSSRVLVDGGAPESTPFLLIDVSAPDVSYDGTQIVFAGLPRRSNGQPYDSRPKNNPNAWRLFAIQSDGSNLRQLTTSDLQLDYTQFGDAANFLDSYDDTDPCWLPDGRIVFSSTRWPAIAHWDDARVSNLYVLELDGSMRRLTHERNGADRPLVDPQTGMIVFSRWWRNIRYPSASDETLLDGQGGLIQANGLTADESAQVGGDGFNERNFWQLSQIKADGTGLALLSAYFRSTNATHVYGGSFAADGSFLGNFYPIPNMTDASGFGGIRRYPRGAGKYQPLIGVTALGTDYVDPSVPSIGVLVGNYASDPIELPDGRILFAWAADINQDYGLYLMNADGTNPQLLLDYPGTSELRPKLLMPRQAPPAPQEAQAAVPANLPPGEQGPFDGDGTFVFHDANVYYNAAVDVEIVSAPAIGSAETIRFFLDHQRTAPVTNASLDWPILLDELPVSASGEVLQRAAPAHLPLFEQLRGHGTVPLSGGPSPDGSAHVSGLNYGAAGSTALCVGCHAGHSQIPTDAADLSLTNLAPGASVRASSSAVAENVAGLIDRKVLTGQVFEYWTSEPGTQNGQWVELVFPVPVEIEAVKLYNCRPGEESEGTLQLHRATIRLFGDAAASQEVASQSYQAELPVGGEAIAFDKIIARVVRVEFDDITGTFYQRNRAGLAEIEVMARGIETRPCPLQGDLDGNGAVDQSDLLLEVVNWAHPATAPADQDGDNWITVLDLVSLSNQLGQICQETSAPGKVGSIASKRRERPAVAQLAREQGSQFTSTQTKQPGAKPKGLDLSY